MPSPFHQAALEAAASVDEWNGEDFRLVPKAAPLTTAGFRDVNDDPVPDAARDPIDFRGVFVARGAVMHARGRNRPETTTAGVAAVRSYVRDVVMSFTYRPARGDEVERVDTGERFIVVAVIEHQLRRYQLDLAEI